MLLPDDFQMRPFAEWNELLRGLIAVWELARSRGLETAMEAQLNEDQHAPLADLFGGLGCALEQTIAASESPRAASEARPAAAGAPIPGCSPVKSSGWWRSTPSELAPLTPDTAVASYFAAVSNGNGHVPDDGAYEGGFIIREFMCMTSRFAQLHRLDEVSMARLAVEVMDFYANPRCGIAPPVPCNAVVKARTSNGAAAERHPHLRFAR